MMKASCILSTFGKYWVRRIISEPWSTRGRNQSEMLITMEIFKKHSLKFDSQIPESPFNDPNHPRLWLQETELSGYGMACISHSADQGSFFCPSQFHKIQTLCLKNFLKVSPSLGLCRCFFLVPFAWVSDAFRPACPSQTLSALHAFWATAVTAQNFVFNKIHFSHCFEVP